MSDREARGLLLVTMEPPPAMAEEFHDWYDTEHVPERLRVPGIRNATRWVCGSGWPRYLALYDLDSAAVMHSPAYLAVSGDNVSPWSHRVLPRTVGRRRVVAEQLPPGTADLPPPEAIATLVVARFAAAPPSVPDLPGLLQQRAFRQVEGPADGWLLLAFDRVVTPDAAHAALEGQGATLLNLYQPYHR